MPHSAVSQYLRRLGFPGEWKDAPEVFRLLKDRGFPASPAAQELLRRFGGLNTGAYPSPPCPPDAQHGPPEFVLDPREVLDDLETVGETEAWMGLKDLCAIGFDLTGLGVMWIAPDGTVCDSFSGSRYSGATPDEVIENLLSGYPDRAR